ncbi:MAG: hypothetical protein Unbinned3891contig1000_32 [Prokaryotic dsDNA virus sp.]|nr:MAG: hypothetical protein Unbinned3891contig1000_32 [Prokaryotic dsDNA virus sp.]|tara:strand:- start:2678 stop:3262 length:585 start_codon:yes stop_codon:yes gene_type:complete
MAHPKIEKDPENSTFCHKGQLTPANDKMVLDNDFKNTVADIVFRRGLSLKACMVELQRGSSSVGTFLEGKLARNFENCAYDCKTAKRDVREPVKLIRKLRPKRANKGRWLLMEVWFLHDCYRYTEPLFIQTIAKWLDRSLEEVVEKYKEVNEAEPRYQENKDEKDTEDKILKEEFEGTTHPFPAAFGSNPVKEA